MTPVEFNQVYGRLMGLIMVILGSWVLLVAILVATGIFHYSLFAQVFDGIVVGLLSMSMGIVRLIGE
jgi:hypothetical protein